MINSSTTFQGIMNKILRNIINEEKITVFVNNILVKTKTEEKYNKIVEMSKK